MNQPESQFDIAMNADDLYLEEVFTDNRVGSLRRLRPVRPSGEPDEGREARFLGSTQILTPAGALPLSFEIPAKTLDEAIAGFGEAARRAVNETMEELRELQRQQASSIVVPKGGVDPATGGIPGVGGGKIRMP